jgi:hypothetical protein
MSTVPNAPAGPRSVPAINPTGVGATFDDNVNERVVQVAPTAINPTLAGATVDDSQNAPLSQLPATTAARINWTPNTGPQAAVRATTPVAEQTAGILDATGAVVSGSGGPPYVAGNVTVGQNQVGTNIVLTPQ